MINNSMSENIKIMRNNLSRYDKKIIKEEEKKRGINNIEIIIK